MDPSAKPATTRIGPANDPSNNQVPRLVDYNLFLTDPTLVSAIKRCGAEWAVTAITKLGALLGTSEAQQWGVDANENPPVLHTHTAQGDRRDEVVFHPAWHNLMRTSMASRLHCLPLVEQLIGAHVARAAMLMLTVQNEAGHTCPISMTFAAMASLKMTPELYAQWVQKICSTDYDPRFLPAAEKTGVLLGMGMTEKQGGSDVRANTTRAEKVGLGGEFLITGHKWFCSAPMCDAFLVLAQAAKGLSCFLLPRWTPSGQRNSFHIQRLKDKLGNRSNASCEVEFDRAWAHLIGEEGRGTQTIIEMVNHTRLDCAVAAAGLMRQALVQALHHARHRVAFGKLLLDQPLMTNVLADLAIESEAATLMAVRLASAFDRSSTDPAQEAFSRIATAVTKYWLCKRLPAFVGEALECLGGNGYVEESGMPRLYREAPLYSIWEGSSNVICLDVLRVLSKRPDALDALFAEIEDGSDSRLAKQVAETKTILARLTKENSDTKLWQSSARSFVERLALALQASLVLRYSKRETAEAFVASRLAGEHGQTFGTLVPTGDFRTIFENSFPH